MTFRKWPKAQVKVGETYDAARMGYPPTKFARVKVTGMSRIKPGEIDDRLAKRDGAASAAEVKAYWARQGFNAKRSCGWSNSNSSDVFPRERLTGRV